MNITLNKKSYEISEQTSLAEFLNENNIDTTINAIAINQIFIPKSKYKTTLLQPNDQIDLVTAMQGG